MAIAKQEFTRFLSWLAVRADAVVAYAIKVANIVSENFDTIFPTSSNRAQRSVTLATLLQRQFAGAATALPRFDASEQEVSISLTRLQSLALGPFRGFRYAESFEFDKRAALLYGPNETGKTSLCGAIEFGFVRSVGEAESKRILAYARSVALMSGTPLIVGGA